jgi:ubiquinone/menaquinone biosynthesis C-methylase UbiE
MNKEYDPELYWDNVAQHINERPDQKIIAGDDEPYYRYKRELFLEWLDKIDFANKSVLEIGSGPGGNLHHLVNKNCKEINGAEISSNMIDIAKRLLHNCNIKLYKVDGLELPFANARFDIVFTSTVLQHNTNESKLMTLIKSICRVSGNEIIIFERVEKRIKGHESNLGRPVEYYASLFAKNEFTMVDKKFLKIQASYYVCGIIRKLFNNKNRKEGAPVSRICYYLETIVLPVTKQLDKIIPSKRDLGMLRFKKHTISA